jgi:glycosyltransferase involved in cell wall biosynthesis
MKSLCLVAFTDYESDARVMRHAESASRAGYAVHVLALRARNTRATETVGGVTVHRLRRGRYRGERKTAYVLSYAEFFWRSFFRLSRLHLRFRFSVIQVCNIPDFLVFTSVLARLLGARVLLDIHDPMARLVRVKFPGASGGFFYRLALWQERLSAAYADRVMTVSDPVKADILIPDGLDGRKIQVIANFPEETIFKATKSYVVSDPIRMIYYGTIAKRFDLSGVLAALARVRQKGRITLKIIGRGNAEVPLAEEIRSLGLEGLVDWEDVLYPVRALPDIIGRHHLGIVPYRPSPATEYMLPVKLLELLAMGIPAIASANVAIRHYIDESLYFAYNPEDMSSLTRLMDALVDAPSLLAEKRRVIMEAPKKCLWEEERGRYLDLLAQMSK